VSPATAPVPAKLTFTVKSGSLVRAPLVSFPVTGATSSVNRGDRPPPSAPWCLRQP